MFYVSYLKKSIFQYFSVSSVIRYTDSVSYIAKYDTLNN